MTGALHVVVLKHRRLDADHSSVRMARSATAALRCADSGLSPVSIC